MSADRTLTALRRLSAAMATGLFLWLICACGGASAAGSLTADSDIAGLRTTMTSDQARQLIEQEFGAHDFPTKTIRFGTFGHKADVVIGFAADIASGRASNGLAKDILNVYVDPNAGSSGILALVRDTGYATGSEILEAVFIQSLADKFGKPVFTDGFQNYYWAAGIDRPYGGDWMDCFRFSNDVAELSSRFAELVNGFHHDAAPQPKCSIFLKVHVVWVTGLEDDSTRYATAFSMALVNVANSYKALSGYEADYWAAVDKAGQERLLRQSQNKPRL